MHLTKPSWDLTLSIARFSYAFCATLASIHHHPLAENASSAKSATSFRETCKPSSREVFECDRPSRYVVGHRVPLNSNRPPLVTPHSGADLLAAILFSPGRLSQVSLRLELCTQHAHGCEAIHVLRPPAVHSNGYAGRHVLEDDGGIRLVTVLTAGT